MPTQYDPAFRERIKTYINEGQPFGPLDAGHIGDSEVATLLFDREIDSLRTVFGRNFLVGRRGAGKSAVLNAQTRKEPKPTDGYARAASRPAYDFVVALNAWREFPSVQKSLAVYAQTPEGFLPVELTAEKWEGVFWYYIGREIQRVANTELQASRSFKALDTLLGNSASRRDTLERDLRELTMRGQDPLTLANLQEAFVPPHWVAVREACSTLLGETKKKVAVTIDSMDEYEIRKRPLQVTLNGLMRAVAQINGTNKNVRIIFCLPAEIYSQLYRLSANPLKDVASVDFLHWSAVGLLQAAAYRYRLFLELFDPKTAEEVSDFDIRDRRGLRGFWKCFLPDQVLNGFQREESSLAYIVRHTQLLPRQLLKFLNDISVRNHELTGGWKLLNPSCIRTGIENTEALIAHEVFSAFKNTYPDALIPCRECLTRSGGPVLTYGELQKLWHKHARRHMEKLDIKTFHEFVGMLSEMGVIGRASAKRGDTDRYIYADFEYRQKDHLIINESHRICIHPLFYGFLQLNTAAYQKTVYPIGTDLDDDDQDVSE